MNKMSRAGDHAGPGFFLCMFLVHDCHEPGLILRCRLGSGWRDARYRLHNMESIVTEWLSERVYLDQSDMHL
ncbi:hypothetical protein PX699_14125 [Sphingobium sp. H39-3-25]|uniref:hypothetical protein n=1 Tax=Sphingobium arseniciresistens TaxID=3030834 RepID=UPI0023B9A047|nr:hypothetical protein [Sphingobium arseniciresistens]